MEELATLSKNNFIEKINNSESARVEGAPKSCLQRSNSLSMPVDSSFILGAMNFGDRLDPISQSKYPCADIPLLHANGNLENNGRSNNNDDVLTEYWTCSTPVTYESYGQWHCAQSDDYFFATCQYVDHDTDLTELTHQHYTELFDLLKDKGFDQLLRMWNYVPLINQDDANGLERYRSFCLGRSLAFGEQTDNKNIQMPAATGIGTHKGKNTIVVLATRESNGITHLENPLQIPAHQYPKQYGPKPPSFARGTSYVCSSDNMHSLYVSGTASITASETVNQGDVKAQLDTTLANIAMLISEHNLKAHNLHDGFTLQDMRSVKVYFRHQDDLKIIKKVCDKAFPSSSDIVYLLADICRHDLDVEIEGYIRFSV